METHYTIRKAGNSRVNHVVNDGPGEFRKVFQAENGKTTLVSTGKDGKMTAKQREFDSAL